MNYYLFYSSDVCIGEGYGVNESNAVRIWCLKQGMSVEYADSLTVIKAQE